MFDLIIKGGDLIDGTGAPRRRVDVGVKGRRIEAIGDLSTAEATKVIDATGRVVTPGFIDVHTHIDAQAFWDSTLSPTPLHGVTTVIAGNCGFSIQPLGTNPDDGAYLMKMLSRVEGMPLESLQQGVPWNWDTTAQYLDALDGTLSINAGFAVGHSALRRVVMGPAATQREATPEELEQMCGLLRDGIRAGAVGFSSSWSNTHNDTEHNMVPSRYASRTELLALCAVLADFEGMMLEFIPTVGPFDEGTHELLAEMSVTAKAPLNWNVLVAHPSNKAEREVKLAAGDVAKARGGKVVALTAPMTLNFRLSFIHGFLLDAVPGWEEVMLMSKAEKIALLSDPEERRRLGELAAGDHPMRHFTNWSKMIIHDTFDAANKNCLGRTIRDIAEERGLSPWDTLCEIALADDLRTSFGHPSVEDEPMELWNTRLETWRDPRTVVGASDAGAHLDMFLSANYSTVLLGEAVVKRKMLPLEEAVNLLTAVPADLYRIVDRGRLVEGAFADLVVLDEHSVGSNEMVYKHDLPGGIARLYADAHGIDSVVCNGVEIVRNNEFTADRPGAILRSGKDTTGHL